MNNRHLLFVLSVAELESFSAAAKACSVTQPTLSAGVKEIEVKLGAQLFERNTRKVKLTSFGQNIMPTIRDLVASENTLKIQAEALLRPRSKLVRIGVSPIVEVSRTVDLIKPYRDRYPEVEFVFKECFVDELEDRLTADKLDLVVWPEAVSGNLIFTSINMYSDPWVFLPNATKSDQDNYLPCRASEVSDQPLILTSGYCGLSQATKKMYEQMDLKLNLYPGRAVSYNMVEEWADLGLGAALLPASKVSRGRKGMVIPVLNEDRSAALLSISASWRRILPTTPYLENLRSFIQNMKSPG